MIGLICDGKTMVAAIFPSGLEPLRLSNVSMCVLYACQRGIVRAQGNASCDKTDG